MIVNRQNLITQGTRKALYSTEDPFRAIVSMNDAPCCCPGKKPDIPGKGILINRISAYLMTALETIGLPTHFVKSINMREQEVKLVAPLPLVMKVHTIATGEFAKRLDLEDGTHLPKPLIEFYLKKKSGDYSLITEDHIMTFNMAESFEMEEAITIGYRANDYLSGLFMGLGLQLANYTIELGRLWGEMGELYLMIIDELSLNTITLKDRKTGRFLDADSMKDHQDLAVRLGLIPKQFEGEDGQFTPEFVSKLDQIENILATDKTRKIRSIFRKPQNAPQQPSSPTTSTTR